MSGSSDELVIEGAVESMNEFLGKDPGSRDGWLAMIAWFELNHDFSDPQAYKGFLKEGGAPWGNKRQPYREQSALALLMVMAPDKEKYSQLEELGEWLCANYELSARDAIKSIEALKDFQLVRELFLTMGLRKNCWAKRKHGNTDRLCGNKLLEEFELSKKSLPWAQAGSATKHPKDYFDFAAEKMGIKKLGGSSLVEPAGGAGAATGKLCNPSDRYNIIGVMDTSVQLFAEIRDAKSYVGEPNTTITVLRDWAWAHIDPSTGHSVSKDMASNLPGVQNGSVANSDLTWGIKVEYPRTIAIAAEDSKNNKIEYRVGIYGGTEGKLLKEEPFVFNTAARTAKHPFSIGESISRIRSDYHKGLFPKGNKEPICPVTSRESAAEFLLDFHTKRLGDWNQGEAINAVARGAWADPANIPARWADAEGFPTSSLNQNLLVRPDEGGCTIGPDPVANVSKLLSDAEAGTMFFTNDYLSGMEAAINGRSVSISQHGVALTTCLQRQEIIQKLNSSWTDWLSSVAKAIGNLLGITGTGTAGEAASQGPPSADASQGHGSGSDGGGNRQKPSMLQRGGEPEDSIPLVLYTENSIYAFDLSVGFYYEIDGVDAITACQIMWAMRENWDLVAYARYANQVLGDSRGVIDEYSEVMEETKGEQLRALLSEVLKVVGDLSQPEYPLCPPGAQVVAGAQQIEDLLSPTISTEGEPVASRPQTIPIMNKINQIRLEFVRSRQDLAQPVTPGPASPPAPTHDSGAASEDDSAAQTQKKQRIAEAGVKDVAKEIIKTLVCYGLSKLFKAPEPRETNCASTDQSLAVSVAKQTAKRILNLRNVGDDPKVSRLSDYDLGLIVVANPDELAGKEDLVGVNPPVGYQRLGKQSLADILDFIQARAGPSVGGSKKLRKGRSPRKSKKRKRKKTRSRKVTRKPRQGKRARKGTRKIRKKP